MKTIIEPFRAKMVEPIALTTRAQRETILQKAGYNPFLIRAEEVLIDLLTDSGTGAMSSEQWAAMMRGDESYAGAQSFFRFEKAVQDLTGYKQIIPTHQGRAAERILFSILGGQDKLFPANAHFDTTRANAEFTGSEAVDLPIPEADRLSQYHPFKGNLNVPALKDLIDQAGPHRIPLCIVTVTNNTCGGQPVSMTNIREVRRLLDSRGIPLFLDACRFAENAYFIQQREPGFSDRPIIDIAREMFSLADGCTFSAKKDGLANTGGFLAMNDSSLADQARNLLILTEGFPTYGGLAGRDLEAIAQGLQEVVQPAYLQYRIRSVAYLADKLRGEGVPFLEPPGGHALYLDARTMLDHIPVEQFPGQALVGALYVEGGIRSVEIGSVMFGKKDSQGRWIPARQELVRLAFPRRVYTQSHVDYVAEVILEIHRKHKEIQGLRIVSEPPFLRHFFARFEPAR
jgi:tryptophanase